MAAGTSTGVAIYLLCDPDTNEPRYLGKANCMTTRMRGHRFDAKNKRCLTHKAKWLRSLKGRDPTVVVLDVVSPDEWQKVERFWIADMRRRGIRLTNFADGGDTSPVEGKRHSEQSKRKMRLAALRNGARPPFSGWGFCV